MTNPLSQIKVFILISSIALAINSQYLPNWESLDSRELPGWYDESKIGIFIHWGVFSVPSFRSEWFWWYWKGLPEPDVYFFMKQNYPPNFEYADFATQFKAEFYDPNYWSDIIEASGANYVVITTKHHEGFCLWPSNHSFNWNAAEVGPKQDLIGALANSIRSRTKNVKFGIYHSLFEWFNPIYLADVKVDYATQNFVRSKTMPELYELVQTYSPDVIWSDGDNAPDYYWNSTEFLAWLYNESQVRDTVVTNDRWGINGISCHHGGFYSCNDRYNPGKLQNHKWENAMTIDKTSWGYRRNANLQDFLTIEDLINTLVSTVSCGGNILINVGPTSYGTIDPIFEERLYQLGAWLKLNGDSIYSTKPWIYQNDTINADTWYTSKGSSVYAILLKWYPNQLVLGSPFNSTFDSIRLLGYNQPLEWSKTANQVVISTKLKSWLPRLKWAWVFEFTNVK